MQNRTVLASWSIRKKLLLFLLIIFLPVFGFIVTSGLNYRHNAIETAENNALLLAQSVAAQQEKVAAGTKQMLSTLAKLPIVQRLDAEACNMLFRELNQLHPSYSTISAVTPDGNMFAASTPFQPGTVNLADRKHIKDAIRTGDFSAGEFIVGRVSKTPSINYTFPVFDRNNKLTAIVVAGFKLDEYADFIKKAKPPEGSAVVITDYAGIRLFRYPENDATTPGKPIPKDSFEWVSGDPEQGHFERIGEDGIRRFYAFKQLRLKENLPPYLYVIVGFATDKVSHQADLAMLGNLFILGIIALIEICLTWVFGNYVFVRPINRLVTASQRFGKGDLDARTDLPHTTDDLGQLAKSFDEMASRLEIRDLERLHAEEALKYSLSLLSASLESTADGILIVGRQGKIVRWNQKFAEMWKIPNEILTACDDRKAINYILTQLVDPEKFTHKVEELYEHPDQSSFDQIEFADGRVFECYSQPQRIDDTIVGRVWSFRDITERKTIENKLTQILREQQIVLDNANIGITMVIDRIQRWVSKKTVDLFQYSREELEGMSTRNFYPSQEAYEQLGRDAYPVLAQGQVYEAEQLLLRRDGTPIWVRLNGKAIEPSDLSLGTIWLLDDITERKKVEEALQEIHRTFDAIVEFLPDATFVIDANGKVTHWNRAIEKMTGILKTDMLGKAHEYSVPFYGNQRWILIDFAMATSCGNEIKMNEYELLKREGDSFIAENFVPQLYQGKGAYLSATASALRDSKGNVIGAIESIRDVTDRRNAVEDRFRLERQLLQAQKAESLGRMAGAISHHFNNMLGAAIGNLELAEDTLPCESESRIFINDAMEASKRAAEISRLMLTYLGQTTAKKEQLNLVRLVEESRSLINAIIPSNVRLITEFPSQELTINADRTHINQIITNLVSNAAEAIEGKDGSITMAVEMADVKSILKQNLFRMDCKPKEGDYVCLSIADTGRGMDEATIEKIFDPFYSTKFTGRGLGLPVVLGLVRTYEGGVTVESKVGEGTVFRVYFPLAKSKELPLKGEVLTSLQIKNSGLVLVIEDEKMVRDMTRTMLERQGYQVMVTGDGFEAIDIFQAHKDEFLLVLLDLSMPGINGWETLSAIRKIQPGVPAILTSGFDETLVMQGQHSEHPPIFLHKPYQKSELSDSIAKATGVRSLNQDPVE